MKKTLIVDDSSVFRLMIVGVLKKGLDNMEFIQANDGIEAMTLINSQRFNLVITDLNMPNMNGIELIKNIRQHKKNKFVKIYNLSGEAEKEQEDEAKQAGANAFTVKSFDPPQFLATVKKLVF